MTDHEMAHFVVTGVGVLWGMLGIIPAFLGRWDMATYCVAMGVWTRVFTV